MDAVAKGAKSVFTSRGVGEVLVVLALVYAFFYVLHRWDDGRYAPQNV